jgi:hypothetical protein
VKLSKRRFLKKARKNFYEFSAAGRDKLLRKTKQNCSGSRALMVTPSEI